MKKSDARKKTEKNEKNMFFSRKKHEMKKTVFFTTLPRRHWEGESLQSYSTCGCIQGYEEHRLPGLIPRGSVC